MSDARFDIWPVLEHYGWDLPSPRGVWQSIKCGAHDDSHASCRISQEAGQVKCLACDFKGDAIDVVRYYEKVNYPDAVRRCEELTEGSDRNVLQSSRGYSRLPSRTRDKRRSRAYTPPRLRQRTNDRT